MEWVLGKPKSPEWEGTREGVGGGGGGRAVGVDLGVLEASKEKE